MAFELLSLDTLVDGNVEAKFIALVGGVWVGCVGLELNGRRSASFRQLFVAENYRGKGIGCELVRLCEQRAQSAGMRNVGRGSGSQQPTGPAVLSKPGIHRCV